MFSQFQKCCLLFFIMVSQIAAKPKRAIPTKAASEPSEYIVKDTTKCEVCRVLTQKLESQFTETGKQQQFIERGYNFELRDIAPRLDYGRSQLRLIESTERVCINLFRINMEYEQKLNDTARAYRYEEIQEMKSKCDALLEKYEEEIEQWYLRFEGTGTSLKDYLCRGIVLKKKSSQGCLGKEQKKKKKMLRGREGEEEVEVGRKEKIDQSEEKGVEDELY